MKTLEQVKEEAMQILNKKDGDRKKHEQLAIGMLVHAGMLPSQAMAFIGFTPDPEIEALARQ